MTCREVRELLGAWAAEELAPEERARVAEHLGECAGCRADAAGWKLLRERTAALPRSLEPPRDLWPAIDRALDQPPLEEPGVRRLPAATRRTPSPRWLRAPALAAAAIVLVVVTAALTILILRGSDTAMARKLKGMPPVATTPAGDSSEDLLRALEAQGVPPETMAIVERNLAVIDVAITELEAALAEDPDNQELAAMLVSTHRRRTELIEGAARAKEEGG